MPLLRAAALRPMVAGALLTLAAFSVPTAVNAAPASLQAACPFASLELVSGVVGQPLTIDEMMISSLGQRDECIFESAEGIVLAGRVAGFFGSSGPEGMASDNLLQLTRTSQELMFTPEPGVGDAATWAEAADPAIRAERLSVLIVRRGADAFFFGVDHSAFQDSRRLTTTLANAVVASSP